MIYDYYKINSLRKNRKDFGALTIFFLKYNKSDYHLGYRKGNSSPEMGCASEYQSSKASKITFPSPRLLLLKLGRLWSQLLLKQKLFSKGNGKPSQGNVDFCHVRPCEKKNTFETQQIACSVLFFVSLGPEPCQRGVALADFWEVRFHCCCHVAFW